MVENQSLMSEAKVLIQVGDSQYLKELLAKHKLSSQSDYLAFVKRLKTHHDYDLAPQICKNGSVEMLKFFRAQLADKDQVSKSAIPTFNLDFVDESGQNCLHYAVARGHQVFVKHILFEDRKNKININQQTHSTKESPLFFAMGKIKSDKDKLRMVQTLLKREDLNVGLVNSNNQYAFEAHQTQLSVDATVNLVESVHLSRVKLNPNKPILESKILSQAYLNDFTEKDRARILNDKDLDLSTKGKLIEEHIFQQGEDFDYRKELIHQLISTQKIQQQLKDLQGQASQGVNPYKFVDPSELKKQLDKKLMEFVGVSLIQNIRESLK